MRNEFEIYIKDNYGEVEQHVFNDAFELFEKFSLPNYQEAYLSLVMNSTMDDPQIASDSFKGNVFSDLVMLVGYHGIDVNTHATSESLCELLNGLQVLENYADPAAIVQYINQDGADIDKLADLLTLVTSKHDTYFLNFMNSVKPALLRRLYEMYEAGANNSNTDGDALENEANIARLKKLNEYDYFKLCHGYEMIKAGLPIGMDFVAYAGYIRSLIDEAEPEQAAKELAVILAMSSDGLLLPQQTYQKYSNFFWDDIDKINRVDLALTRVLGLIETAAREESNEANFEQV